MGFTPREFKSLARTFRKVAEYADLNDDIRMTHTLLHGFAEVMANQRVDIMKSAFEGGLMMRDVISAQKMKKSRKKK